MYTCRFNDSFCISSRNDSNRIVHQSEDSEEVVYDVSSSHLEVDIVYYPL